MAFTCTKCDTRSIKTFSRNSYERGLVLVRCPGCDNLHLVADHLGWFGDKGFQVAGAPRQLSGTGPGGAAVSGAGGGGLLPHLSAEELLGASRVQQLIDAVAASEAAAQVSQTPLQDPPPAAAGATGAAGAPSRQVARTAVAEAVEISPEDAEAYLKRLRS